MYRGDAQKTRARYAAAGLTEAADRIQVNQSEFNGFQGLSNESKGIRTARPEPQRQPHEVSPLPDSAEVGFAVDGHLVRRRGRLAVLPSEAPPAWEGRSCRAQRRNKTLRFGEGEGHRFRRPYPDACDASG